MSETVSMDSTRRALTVALVVAFVCGLLVSAVAVNLRPIQRANIEAERLAQLQLVLTALSDIGREQSIDSQNSGSTRLAANQKGECIHRSIAPNADRSLYFAETPETCLGGIGSQEARCVL